MHQKPKSEAPRAFFLAFFLSLLFLLFGVGWLVIDYRSRHQRDGARTDIGYASLLSSWGTEEWRPDSALWQALPARWRAVGDVWMAERALLETTDTGDNL